MCPSLLESSEIKKIYCQVVNLNAEDYKTVAATEVITYSYALIFMPLELTFKTEENSDSCA